LIGGWRWLPSLAACRLAATNNQYQISDDPVYTEPIFPFSPPLFYPSLFSDRLYRLRLSVYFSVLFFKTA
jgi:hypothetical protein